MRGQTGLFFAYFVDGEFTEWDFIVFKTILYIYIYIFLQ